MIVTLYKNTGERSDCYYRDISLLSIVWKLYTHIVLVHLQKLAEVVYPESQCGFRAECSMYSGHILSPSASGEMQRTTEAPLHHVHSLHKPD